MAKPSRTCRAFKGALEEARQSIVNRAKFVREAYGRVEADLDLVGATGIEDKLQEKVEETIAKLKVRNREDLRLNLMFELIKSERRKN